MKGRASWVDSTQWSSVARTAANYATPKRRRHPMHLVPGRCARMTLSTVLGPRAGCLVTVVFVVRGGTKRVRSRLPKVGAK